MESQEVSKSGWPMGISVGVCLVMGGHRGLWPARAGLAFLPNSPCPAKNCEMTFLKLRQGLAPYLANQKPPLASLVNMPSYNSTPHPNTRFPLLHL